MLKKILVIAANIAHVWLWFYFGSAIMDPLAMRWYDLPFIFTGATCFVLLLGVSLYKTFTNE